MQAKGGGLKGPRARLQHTQAGSTPLRSSPSPLSGLSRVRSTPEDSTTSPVEGERKSLDTLFEQMERQNASPLVDMDKLKSTVSKVQLPTVDFSKPFRFPAYGFLVLSILLGISFTGSLTELAGGHPLVSVP